VLLDRACAALAERRAAQFLSTPFGHPATVRLHGRPFLTQLLRGRYRDVEVTGRLRIGEIGGATLDARVTNAYLPLRVALGRSRARELPCEHVQGTLVLPYEELAGAARIPNLAFVFDGGRLRGSATLPVPGIGPLTRVHGEAVPTIDRSLDGDGVWLRIRGVSVAGITVPSLVLAQLVPALEVRIALPQLPYGLRLDDLRPVAEGLVVHGSAGAVVFRQPDGLSTQDGHPDQ
jgi:LmeA-like phospholipid-binding